MTDPQPHRQPHRRPRRQPRRPRHSHPHPKPHNQHQHHRPPPLPLSRPEQVPKHPYHAIRPPIAFQTAVPHACGHDANVRLKFPDRPRPFELIAAGRRAAATARYRVCASCSASASAGGELENALQVEIERRGKHADEHVLEDLIARIIGLRDHCLVAAGNRGSPTTTTARELLDSWARVAVARLDPIERGRLLFVVLTERNDDDVQWVSDGLAQAAATAAAAAATFRFFSG